MLGSLNTPLEGLALGEHYLWGSWVCTHAV